MNFMRFPHYPHAALEYDLCDQDGILAWCEDGHSNSKDIVGPTAAQIVTEMVKQNYNHPSIVVWSMGNESNPQVADQCVPIAKALDPSRPVGVANQKSDLADFHTAHCYYGWYGPDLDRYKPGGFISEIGAGGVVTTHCDYGNADWTKGKYEPEEYQQIVSENNFQKSFHGDDSHLGMFCVWCLRDFSDVKYRGPVGINTKGLETYAGDRKDVYYLYRTFLRPDEATVWITSKRYFLRRDAADNGIKVYSNAPKVTLTLNGKTVSTLDNGKYVIPNGPYLTHWIIGKGKNGEPPPPPIPPRPYVPEKIDNVFYWPVPLITGKNTVTATDDKGNSDSATIYYYGDPTAPVPADATLPIANLASSNANNPAYFMDMPVHAQWPLYYDLDSTADNSWNTNSSRNRKCHLDRVATCKQAGSDRPSGEAKPEPASTRAGPIHEPVFHDDSAGEGLYHGNQEGSATGVCQRGRIHGSSDWQLCLARQFPHTGPGGALCASGDGWGENQREPGRPRRGGADQVGASIRIDK